MAELKKGLSLYGLTMVAIGSCIGSGIFMTPSLIAHYLPSPLLILGVWLIGGVISISGALTYAEVGALFPQAGGIYVFLREAYGDIFGFLFGWTTILVVNTGGIAAMCLTSAGYISFVFPMSRTGTLVTAILVLVAVTLVNLFGVKLSELFASLFTGMKLIGILVVIFVGLFLTAAPANNFSIGTLKAHMEGFVGNPISAMGLALIGVVFSFTGYQHASYLAAEAKNVKRNLPLAMIIGVGVVCLTYLSINLAYMFLLPVETVAGSSSVAAEAVTTIFPGGALFVAILIAISTLGTAGIMTLSGPRIYYAMARDGLFFQNLAKVHPKYCVPVNAILAQSAWALVLLLFWGTFQDLVTYVVFTDWVFLTLAGLSLFVFRRRFSKEQRPYSTWLYPIPPAVFVAIGSFIIINTLIQKPLHSLAGLGLLALGIPVYYLFKKKRGAVKS